MPIEIQYITAVSMSGSCNTSATANILIVRHGQVRFGKNIVPSEISVFCASDYSPPMPVFVVGKVGYGCCKATFGKLASPVRNIFLRTTQMPTTGPLMTRAVSRIQRNPRARNHRLLRCSAAGKRAF